MQIVGIAVYSFLVVSFYTFFGLFLGNRIAEITVTTIFSFVVLYTTLYSSLICIPCSSLYQYQLKLKLTSEFSY